MSANFPLLDSTADFDDKWQKYTQTMHDSLEFDNFESSPRSSTPVCDEFENFLDLSIIVPNDTETQLPNNMVNYQLIPNSSIFLSTYLYESTNNSSIFYSDLTTSLEL